MRVYYSKGGKNWFSDHVSPRGYYISVRPVTLQGGMVRFDLFSGYCQLLFETGRYSAKQFAKAVEMARDFENTLISTVMEKQAG